VETLFYSPKGNLSVGVLEIQTCLIRRSNISVKISLEFDLGVTYSLRNRLTRHPATSPAPTFDNPALLATTPPKDATHRHHLAIILPSKHHPKTCAARDISASKPSARPARYDKPRRARTRQQSRPRGARPHRGLPVELKLCPYHRCFPVEVTNPM
jgi:hypothetical protein